MGKRHTPYYYPQMRPPRRESRGVVKGLTWGALFGLAAIGYSHAISTGGEARTAVPSASSTPKPGAAPQASASPGATQKAEKRLVVVIDPGHGTPAAGTKDARDPETGYKMADYKNTPETTEVYDVALLVKKMLEGSFDVHLTKKFVDEGPSLRVRAERANAFHPDIVVSIHTDHTQPNTMQWVTPQKVGQTRGITSAADGTHQLTFTDKKIACISNAYAEQIASTRTAASGIPAQLHDLNFTAKKDDGSITNTINRAPGNISWVQLLSQGDTGAPWVYNEFGGKKGSSETTELSADEKQAYATGVANGIQAALSSRDSIFGQCQ